MYTKYPELLSGSQKLKTNSWVSTSGKISKEVAQFLHEILQTSLNLHTFWWASILNSLIFCKCSALLQSSLKCFEVQFLKIYKVPWSPTAPAKNLKIAIKTFEDISPVSMKIVSKSTWQPCFKYYVKKFVYIQLFILFYLNTWETGNHREKFTL